MLSLQEEELNVKKILLDGWAKKMTIREGTTTGFWTWTAVAVIVAGIVIIISSFLIIIKQYNRAIKLAI